MRVVVVLVAVLLLCPASARAVEVKRSGGVLTITATAGEKNDVRIELWLGQSLRVTDVVPLTVSGAGCTIEDTYVVCDSTGVTGYDVNLGDGDDRFESMYFQGVAHGGSGADTLIGGHGQDTLYGDDGDDVIGGGGDGDGLFGGAGDDRLDGGRANDRLEGGPDDDRLNAASGNEWQFGDADTLSGGTGEDSVDYSNVYIPLPVSSTGVTVDLDGNADDGSAGEGDNALADLEHIIGSWGDDRLTGNAAENVIDPGAGQDAVNGGAGEDILDLSARAGAMTVDLDERIAGGWISSVNYAHATLTAIEGAWTGSGDDVLLGDGSANWFDGGDGADFLLGGMGADVLDGGDGYDVASYEDRAESVRADLDGLAGDDGAAGEGDTIGTDIEDLYGGDGADELTGDSSDNELYGGAGADLLVAGAGDDYLEGEAGTDRVSGDAGDDTLVLVDGERDTAFCGEGRDDGVADDIDLLSAACETFERVATPAPAPPPPAAVPTPTPTPTPSGTPRAPDVRAPVLTARANAQRLSDVRRRGLAVSVRCDEACAVELRVTVTARDARRTGLKPRGNRPLQIARLTRTLSAGRTHALRIKLPPKAMRRGLTFSASVAASDGAGNLSRRTVRISVRR